MISNKETRKAVEFLIDEYKNDTHNTSTRTCSLCKLFLRTNKYETCGKCPNSAFKNYFGCLRRGVLFSSLDMDNFNKNPVYKFWKEVLELIPDDTKCFKLKPIKEQILTIAIKINNN